MLRYTGSPASEMDLRHSQESAADGNPGALASEDRASCNAPPSTNFADGGDTLGAKLARFAELTADESAALRALSCNVRCVSAEQTIIQEGRTTNYICLLIEGFAYRYKLLPGGSRQILGYLIPGDMCDTHYMVFNRPDHSLTALCNSKIAQVPIDRIAAIVALHPGIAAAIACSALVDSAVLREWLLNVGQRNGEQRLAHLICELGARLKLVGRVSADGSFEVPVNQATLADTIGLTVVHTNRILQRLRCAGLICLRQRRITILDHARLVSLAGFEDNYLHLQGHRF